MASDQELIIQFQESINREANFTALLKKHQQKVYYQIKRIVTDHADADDIAQLVWIKIWDKLDGFKMESEFTSLVATYWTMRTPLPARTALKVLKFKLD